MIAITEQKPQRRYWPGHQGRPVMSSAPSVELQDLKDRYMAWMMATGYAEDSLKAAHADIEWLFRFLAGAGIARIADVTPEGLNDYSLWFREHKSMKNESQTVSLMHIAQRLIGVKQFFKWLAHSMIVLYDPAEDLELPRIHYGLPKTILTQEEVRKLLDAPDLKSPVGYRDKTVLELVYATGIRTAELFKLKVSDVDLKARTVFVRLGKGGKDRLLPLPGLTVGYLTEYIEKVRPRFIKNAKGGDHGTLFVSYTGTAFDRQKLCVLFKRATKTAKL